MHDLLKSMKPITRKDLGAVDRSNVTVYEYKGVRGTAGDIAARFNMPGNLIRDRVSRKMMEGMTANEAIKWAIETPHTPKSEHRYKR